MDLSKAYDSEPYDFQIAKLKIYSFDKTSLHLLTSVIGKKGLNWVPALGTVGK